MEKLLKEEILRISEMMEIDLPSKSDYKECERFSGSPQKMLVCKKIASLKGWLHKDEGLGLKNIINRKTEKLKTDIPDDLKRKYIEGVSLLQSIDKINEKEKDYFITKKVNGGKLVYMNGEWQPINKLNTNYFDLAEMVTDMIYKGGENAKPIIQNVIKDPKSELLKLKPYLERLINKYFENPEVLTDYTKNIQRTTAIGETAEDKVRETLEDMGFKTDYAGGNGDLIDMTFGTDLIMTSPKHGTKTIQVKNLEKAWNRNDEYSYVDWVIIANPFTVYDNKTKEKIEL